MTVGDPAGEFTSLGNALAAKARVQPGLLDALLVTAGEEEAADDCRTTSRVRFVRRDANGQVRTKALARLVADHVIDYCIPRKRIDEARLHAEQTGSTSRLAELDRQARDLFTKSTSSGEGGELFLFLLLEQLLGLPQILCKMSLKTNQEVHYHGVDGVHAEALGDGRLAVYWGESKLYATPTEGVTECLQSLTPFLKNADSDAADRDILLLRENVDLGDIELTEHLVRYFDERDDLSAQVELRGACLVGFSHDDYPNPCNESSAVAELAAEAISRWKTHVLKRVNIHDLNDVVIEIFLLPFPSVGAFREAVAKELGLQEEWQAQDGASQ